MTLAFPIVRERQTNSTRVWRTAVCGKCGHSEQIHDGSTVGWPDALVAKKFAQRGWRVGAVRKRDLCPSCAHPSIKAGAPS